MLKLFDSRLKPFNFSRNVKSDWTERDPNAGLQIARYAETNLTNGCMQEPASLGSLSLSLSLSLSENTKISMQLAEPS